MRKKGEKKKSLKSFFLKGQDKTKIIHLSTDYLSLALCAYLWKYVMKKKEANKKEVEVVRHEI